MAWTDTDKEAAFHCYATHGTLRAGHRAFLSQRVSQGQAPTEPRWNTYRSWAKAGKWKARQAKVTAKVEARTEDTLATLRAKRLRQVGAALDDCFKEPEKVLRDAKAGEVAKFVELEDRLAGGDLPPAEGSTLRIEVAWKQPKKGAA